MASKLPKSYETQPNNKGIFKRITFEIDEDGQMIKITKTIRKTVRKLRGHLKEDIAVRQTM